MMNRFYEIYCYKQEPFRTKLFSPLKKNGYIPEKYSEIFVSGIPSYATVYDLAEYFDEVGEIFQIRLMTKVDGQTNRGFAYVKYMNKQLAKKALEKLPHRQFLGSTPLFLQPSIDNCKIYLGNISERINRYHLWDHLKNIYNVTKIVNVTVHEPDKSRQQHAFLEFSTHEDASHFRAKFMNKLYLFGKMLKVDWAKVFPEKSEQRYDWSKILVVRNLCISETSMQFAGKIYQMTERRNIDKIYKHKDLAYIHLNTYSEAKSLMTKLKNYYAQSIVEVEFFTYSPKYKPRDFPKRATSVAECCNYTGRQRFCSTSTSTTDQLTLPTCSPTPDLVEVSSVCGGSSFHYETKKQLEELKLKINFLQNELQMCRPLTTDLPLKHCHNDFLEIEGLSFNPEDMVNDILKDSNV
ncbi:hypothetical protein ABEB36_006370 [Hypothenemus hampei]|uniref:RRM domain-containing protein n=1 Tax=Hypothenemus hampei TaxID=57062 RepID=A0ABD1EQS0_HYPHA